MEYRHYETFKDLQLEKPELADMLVEAVGEGPWQEEYLMYYPTLEDLAMYEVKEGWYACMGLPEDFKGAPNLYDYIDYKALGEALQDSWDDSVYWSDGESVVMTSYGWQKKQ